MTYTDIRKKIESGFYGTDTPNWMHTSVQDGFRQDVKEATGVSDKPKTKEEKKLYGRYIYAYSSAWHAYRRHSWNDILEHFIENMETHKS